jgi:hypothetical protein
MENETKAEETTVAEVIPPKNGRKSSETRDVPASENGDSNPKETPLARARGGPRTPMGKERSRQNAVKHGILARTAVLDGESYVQFDSLLRGLRTDFQPSGTLENLLVEKLASLVWRYRRLLVTERAEIRMGERFNLLTAKEERLDRQEALVLFTSLKRVGPGLLSRWDNPLIRERCIGLLKGLKRSVEICGFRPESDWNVLRIIFGDGLYSEIPVFYSACRESGTVPEEPKKIKALLLESLTDCISLLEHHSKLSTDNSSCRKRIERKCSGVPEASRLDRMLRYEAALERAFDRTLNQLERLQRMRLGQPVSPPININLSNS